VTIRRLVVIVAVSLAVHSAAIAGVQALRHGPPRDSVLIVTLNDVAVEEPPPRSHQAPPAPREIRRLSPLPGPTAADSPSPSAPGPAAQPASKRESPAPVAQAPAPPPVTPSEPLPMPEVPEQGPPSVTPPPRPPVIQAEEGSRDATPSASVANSSAASLQAVAANRAGGAPVGGEPAAGGRPSASGSPGRGSGSGEGKSLALARGGGGGGAGEYAGYLASLRQRLQQALRYPPSARRQGLTGTVQLEIVVRADGSIGAVTVVTSSSYPTLDEAAVEAVRHLPPSPFPPGVTPRVLRTRLPVVFELR
jgi:protein TonB